VKKLNFKSTPDYKYLRNLFFKYGKSIGVNYGENDYDWSQSEREKEKARLEREKKREESNPPLS
jgi:hypothetical protein